VNKAAIQNVLVKLLIKGMFPPAVRSDVSRSISNEFSLKLHLNSLLIFLLTLPLTPGGNIPLEVMHPYNYHCKCSTLLKSFLIFTYTHLLFYVTFVSCNGLQLEHTHKMLSIFQKILSPAQRIWIASCCLHHLPIIKTV
jgi:hypothetical protein